VLASITPAVAVQPVEPDSNPGFAKSCELELQLPAGPLAVTETLVLCEPDAAVPVRVSVKVWVAVALLVMVKVAL